MNDESRRRQIRERGNVVIYSFVRHSLYAFYKLVDDGLRENSLSDHG